MRLSMVVFIDRPQCKHGRWTFGRLSRMFTVSYSVGTGCPKLVAPKLSRACSP